MEWETKTGSGFDTFLIEGFQFAGIERNLDKVRWMAGYPFEVLHRHFNASWPWQRDYVTGKRSRAPIVRLWAYDHICLFARSLPLPRERRYHR